MPEHRKEKERARLQAIIDKPKPARKPGHTTRNWEDDRRRAFYELGKLERGEWVDPGEDDGSLFG